MRAVLLLVALSACMHEVVHDQPYVGWGIGVSTNGPPEPWRLKAVPRIREGGGRLSIPVGNAPGSITPTVGERPSTIDYTSGQIYEDQHAVVGNFTPPLVLLPPEETPTSSLAPANTVVLPTPGEIPAANTITVNTPLPIITAEPAPPPVTPTQPAPTPVVPPLAPTQAPVTPTAPPLTPTQPPLTPTQPPVTPTPSG